MPVQRGRKSATEIAVQNNFAIAGTSLRPEPPADLTDAQAAVWRSTVDSMPDDWFLPVHYAALKELSRTVVSLELLAQYIDAAESAEPVLFGLLDDYYAQRDKLQSQLLRLKRSMRLNHQSIRGRQGQHEGDAPGKDPWQFNPQ